MKNRITYEDVCVTIIFILVGVAIAKGLGMA